MKIKVTAFHNTKLNCYTKPEVDDREVETIKTAVQRSLHGDAIKFEDTVLGKFDGIEFCIIGEYDDETGVLTSDIKVLVDCGAYVKTLVSKKSDDKEN